MSFYADEFLSAKPGVFEKKEFNVGTDKSLETEVSESLNAFGIRGKVIGSEAGPCITRVYFKLDRGVRFSSIEPLTEDLKMSLGTSSIKIMVDPEWNAVAIEVPNAKRANIPFGNVFYATHSGMALPAALGADSKGNPVYLDIADTPHLLIAGTTGSGKSVCLNTIISSLALNTRPTELQFLLIDPKGTEFVQYESLKNLISGRIIDDVETSLNSLKWLVKEMECRYKILKKCKCRSIDEYRRKRDCILNDGISTCFTEDMPYIVVVIDEYADLMMNSANALQENVKKLGQKARAAGIHLVLATQRPSAKIIDGDIKTNMPTRIALKVSSIADSKTILDYGGAERLLGKGDMLLKGQDQEDPQRVHGCFISDEEIKNAIELLPQKNLYRINEEDVFEHDIHDLHAQEDLKKHATWGELNAVSKIILENFSEFIDREYDTIYQVCARRLGMDKSRVDIVFSDVNNAINDSEFYQILLRLCSEHNEKYDCPFVKVAIYSSSLNLEKVNGCDLFVDYILEQSFENDDSAAMTCMYFWDALKVFQLDDLKKNLDEFYEKGNEKAKEYLTELVGTFVPCVTNFDYQYSPSPKNVFFDQLLAEVYPPLMDYLIETENGRRVISDAVYSNSLIEDFIAERAHVDKCWRDFAVNYFCDDPSDAPLSESPYSRIVLKLAIHDVDDAIEVLCRYPNAYELEKSFYELTEYGRKIVVNRICEEFNPKVWYSECRQEYLIFKNALEGNDRAVSCVNHNYAFFEEYLNNNSKIQEIVVEKAKEGLNEAIEFVYGNVNVDEFAQIVIENDKKGDADAWRCITENVSVFCNYIMEKADNADVGAWMVINKNVDGEESCFHEYVEDCVCENSKFYRENRNCSDEVVSLAKIVVLAHPRIFWYIVLKFACNGNVECQNVIYKNPQIESFQQYVLDEAQLGDDDAIEVIYCYPDVDDFRDYILQQAEIGDCDAKKVVLKNLRIAPFQECICKLISSNDEGAKNIVLANVKYDLFQNCIVELALQGDCDAKKVVLENPEIAPFRECICKLASSNDEGAKDVVLANVKYDLFQNCIVELALQGDCDAKKVVLENPEIAPFWECICKLASSNDGDAEKAVLAKEKQNCSVKLVLQGDCDAKKVVLENPEITLFQKCICKLAASSDEEAKAVVLANVKYELFQKCIVELVLQGDCSAKKVVIENPEIALFQKHICEIATSDDEDAKKTILDNFEICLFQECICKMALSGDERAKNVVYANEKNASCRKFIVSEAYQNVERALKCIESNPQNKEYESFLIVKCFEQNEWALAIICDNSDYYGHWINKIIKSQYDKNNLKELLVEKILHLAKYDDNALKYVVCENPQEEKFKDLIAEKIKQNNDVVECMCRYYLQKISSDKRNYFGEFVRQRISKEFGLCFESDDVALKRSIGYLSYRNDSLYFVLAKAWGGNKLALDVFRRSFEFFGPAIIECLRDSDSQIWKYAMDCVKSESTGKIIKELAENGNGMANEIVLNFQLLCS